MQKNKLLERITSPKNRYKFKESNIGLGDFFGKVVDLLKEYFGDMASYSSHDGSDYSGYWSFNDGYAQAYINPYAFFLNNLYQGINLSDDKNIRDKYKKSETWKDYLLNEIAVVAKDVREDEFGNVSLKEIYDDEELRDEYEEVVERWVSEESSMICVRVIIDDEYHRKDNTYESGEEYDDKKLPVVIDAYVTDSYGRYQMGFFETDIVCDFNADEKDNLDKIEEKIKECINKNDLEELLDY